MTKDHALSGLMYVLRYGRRFAGATERPIPMNARSLPRVSAWLITENVSPVPYHVQKMMSVRQGNIVKKIQMKTVIQMGPAPRHLRSVPRSMHRYADVTEKPIPMDAKPL
jgi:L-fucose isomerase-like protein